MLLPFVIFAEPETLARLAEIPTIRGVKEEAGIQPAQATAYALLTPPDFSIYCGDDRMVLQVLPQRGIPSSQLMPGMTRAA